MCNLCVNGERVMCSACDREVCSEVEEVDDFVRHPYVTSGGDLYCDLCGPQIDVGVGPAVDCNPELADAQWTEFVDLDLYNATDPLNPETDQP